MKNIITSLFIFISISVIAQRNYPLSHPFTEQTIEAGSRSLLDTIYPWGIDSITPNLYTSQNGGYIVGVNGFGDKQFVQMFINDHKTYIKGGIFWFGNKRLTSGNSNSKILFKLFALDSNNLTNLQGVNKKGAGTILAQVAINAIDILSDTTYAGYNYIQFANPILIDSGAGYGLGFDISQLATGDTVGLVTSTDGEGGQKDLSIEQWANGSWNSFYDTDNWDTDFDLYILAVTDTFGITSKLENRIFGTVSASAYPNPTNQTTTLYIANNLQPVNATIYTLAGLKVQDLISNQLIKSCSFDTSQLALGIYFIQIWNNEGDFQVIKLVKE